MPDVQRRRGVLSGAARGEKALFARHPPIRRNATVQCFVAVFLVPFFSLPLPLCLFIFYLPCSHTFLTNLVDHRAPDPIRREVESWRRVEEGERQRRGR